MTTPDSDQTDAAVAPATFADLQIHPAVMGVHQGLRNRPAGEGIGLYPDAAARLAEHRDDGRLGVVPGREQHFHAAARR